MGRGEPPLLSSLVWTSEQWTGDLPVQPRVRHGAATRIRRQVLDLHEIRCKKPLGRRASEVWRQDGGDRLASISPEGVSAYEGLQLVPTVAASAGTHPSNWIGRETDPARPSACLARGLDSDGSGLRIPPLARALSPRPCRRLRGGAGYYVGEAKGFWSGTGGPPNCVAGGGTGVQSGPRWSCHHLPMMWNFCSNPRSQQRKPVIGARRRVRRPPAS